MELHQRKYSTPLGHGLPFLYLYALSAADASRLSRARLHQRSPPGVVPPVKMLVIVSLFTFIVESAFHLDNEILTLKTNIPEIDKIIKWFNDNKSWGTLFFQAFYILPTWVVFRFAPRYPRHTLPEGFFVQVFLSTLSLLLTFIDYLGLSVFENIISTFFSS